VAGKEAERNRNSQEQTTQCVFPRRYAEKYQQATSYSGLLKGIRITLILLAAKNQFKSFFVIKL
jgi:hypothetical protein